MLKASALYMVIIIALVIGILCASLVATAYFYRLQFQKTSRAGRLQNNVGSGINILLASKDSDYRVEKAFDLFRQEKDSVALTKIPWGVYDLGIAKAFDQKDTLYRVFSIACGIDSGKWAALYVIDEDRPLSVSGSTAIRGDAFIPRAGVKEAYVDGKAYQGDKRLIIGRQKNSDKKLPELLAGRLAQLEQVFKAKPAAGPVNLTGDSLQNSFLQPTRILNFGNKLQSLENTRIGGHVLLFSDTTITLDNTTQLANCIIFARVIVVKSGFTGTCQLFATDSIRVEHDCMFNYPSCLGVLRFTSAVVNSPGKISIGENTHITGVVFSYDKTNGKLKPLLDLGKNVQLTGQVYSQGIVGLQDGVVINGSLFTSRFLYQSTYTRYENYIINATLDEGALSPYYLSPDLMPTAAGKKKKVLQWLEVN
jgi:hypothetical protein